MGKAPRLSVVCAARRMYLSKDASFKHICRPMGRFDCTDASGSAIDPKKAPEQNIEHRVDDGSLEAPLGYTVPM